LIHIPLGKGSKCLWYSTSRQDGQDHAVIAD
jgi:hypothetical protein